MSGEKRGCIGCLIDEYDHSCGFVAIGASLTRWNTYPPNDATQEQGIRLLSTRSTERSRVASATSVPDATDIARVPSTSEGEGT